MCIFSVETSADRACSCGFDRSFLFDRQTFHQPAKFLPGYQFRFIGITWPFVFSAFQAFVKQYKTVLFPEQSFDAVTSFPAEQKQTPGEYIKSKILLHDSRKSVYCLTHISVSAHNVDMLRMAHITYHRRTPSSCFRVSALKSSGRLTTTFRTVKDICSCDTAISGSVLTGTISCFSTSPHKALRTRFRR